MSAPRVVPLTGGVDFGAGIPAEVNAVLQAAAVAVLDTPRCLELLERAHAMAPEQLEVHVALYKFCCYRGMHERARAYCEDAIRLALAHSGRGRRWRELGRGGPFVEAPDGALRHLLYSIKALAFIALRQGDSATAQEALDLLAAVDPGDHVGGSVVRAIADGAGDGERS